ncbi:MAG: hypothetical protein OC190_15210 [Novosphingobium aromaticivorans]|jgi:cytochrome c oxidase cbb3-type subunit 1|nr:hypothetical protein [Novosphingobium aromaticivorans]
MILTLTEAERQIALGISVAVALGGLVLAAAGTQDTMEVHGWLILVFGAICAVVVIRDLWGPEPPRSRLESYYDEPIKAGIIASMAWAVVAMFVGVWVAALLAFPDCPSSKHLAQIWRGGNGEQASSGVCF